MGFMKYIDDAIAKHKREQEFLRRYFPEPPLPPGYYGPEFWNAPVTELLPLGSPPPTDVNGNPLPEIVGRPVWGDWDELQHALWPRPDPSKRWRLFIQEDTRP